MRIKRYKSIPAWFDGAMQERSDGEYVLYADHEAAVAQAYQRGYTAGYNDHASAAQHWQDTHGAYRQHGQGENP